MAPVSRVGYADNVAQKGKPGNRPKPKPTRCLSGRTDQPRREGGPKAIGESDWLIVL